MKKPFFIIVLLILVYSAIAQVEELKPSILFQESTQVSSFSFQRGSLYVVMTNPAIVEIQYMSRKDYTTPGWKNILVFIDVGEKENEWIVWNTEEEDPEKQYFEVHIKKSTFEKIDTIVKSELDNRGLIHKENNL
ncbi:hypothetical protein AYK26_00755 [Euryarchaeota archaeon SM23-78]|nr:MAG: hypothetical protein AYK26_00755 [Euryarchaeota archaeon SM23-78]